MKRSLFSPHERALVSLCAPTSPGRGEIFFSDMSPLREQIEALDDILLSQRMAAMFVWRTEQENTTKQRDMLAKTLFSKLSKEQQKRLKSAYMSAWVGMTVRKKEVTSLVTSLEARGIPVLLYKGIAYNRTLYQEPHLRTMSDIDLIIPPQDVEKAHTLLESMDYKYAGNEHPAERLYIHAEHKLHLDLHFHTQRPHQSNLKREELFSSPVLTPDGFKKFPETWEFLFHIYHQCKHVFHPSEVRLLSYLELRELYLRVVPNWNEVVSLAHKWEMKKLLACGLWILDELSPGLVSPEHKVFSCPLYLKQLIHTLRHTDPEDASIFSALSYKSLYNLFLLSFIDNRSKQRKYIRMRLRSFAERFVVDQWEKEST